MQSSKGTGTRARRPWEEEPLTQRRAGTQGTSQGAPLPTSQQLSLTSLALQFGRALSERTSLDRLANQ